MNVALLAWILGCAEEAPYGAGATLRDADDFAPVLKRPTARMSADGRWVLGYDADAVRISSFVAPAETPRWADAVVRPRAFKTVVWRTLDPTGARVIVATKDGSFRWWGVPNGNGLGALANVGTEPAWIEPLWSRDSLLVAVPEGEGIRVLEVPLAGGVPVERFRSATADDVVFDAQIRPRYAFEHTPGRHGRGLRLTSVQPTTPDGKALGAPLVQVSWIEDTAPAPRVGAGPVSLLGWRWEDAGTDLSGLGVVDDRGWTPTWSPAWADATRWLVSADGTVDAVAEEGERLRWHPFTDDGAALLALQEGVGRDVRVVDRSADDRRWLVETWSGSSPAREAVWDLETGEVLDVGEPPPPWRPVEPMVLEMSDGLRVAAYLTLPDPARYGPAPWPLVVQVHGGPWSGRHRWTWDERAQRLADQGYAVLAVNFRGTHGWGWTLVNRGEFGDERMLGDVDEAIDQVVARGVADPRRIAMVGASYGGHAALAFATAESPRLRCAIAGLTYGNITTGGGGLNVDSVATPEWREAHSPDRFTHRIRSQILVWTGGMDGDNPDSIATFVGRARNAGKPVTWVRFPEEGHGLRDPASRDALDVLESRFLSRCLGGPARPFGNTLRGPNLEVLAGVAELPGLREALAPDASPYAGTSTP